jgi:tetratricopeptide (TPR) repeat protein
MLDINGAIDAALAGYGLLFTGAGMNEGATNLRGEPLKRGSQLAGHFAAAAGLAGDSSLTDASEEYADKFGEDALVRELQQEFTVKTVGDAQIALAQVPWRKVFTTNYDNALEVAYAQVGLKLLPVVPSDNPQHIATGSTVSIHLNGYVDRMNRDNIGSEIKLTDSSYLTASLVDSVWMLLFRQEINAARAIFFVGYSVSDLDIGRLLFATPELAAKCFFVLGTAPDAASLRRAKNIGQALAVPVSQFAHKLLERRKTFVSMPNDGAIGRSIMKFEAPTSLSAPNDESVFNVLLKGEVEPAFVWSSLNGGQPYILERSVVPQIVDQVKAGARAILVQSDMGNGKTLVVETVKARAIEAGRDVYSMFRRTDDLFVELDTVLSRPSAVLLVVEEYQDWLDAVEYVSLRAKSNCTMLLTARTSTHDVRVDDLYGALHEQRLFEFAIDRLDDKEVRWFVDYLDRYGLWGEMAGWSRSRKESLITGTSCRREMHAVLLKVLEAPQIASRLAAVFNAITNRRDYYEVIISMLVLTILNQHVAVSTLLDIWGDVPLDLRFRRNAAVAQLVNFAKGDISVRSAVAAEFILRKVADANVVVPVLTRIARKADAAASASVEYRAMIRTLMRFNGLQAVLPERERRGATLRYYESIKVLSSCERNPHFWLQYAIASLVYGDLDRAERYFQTAYSLARGRSYDTYQIDNHYARYILTAVVESGDSAQAMAAFRRARKTINEQIKNERLHYPYRVAELYSDFYDRFESRLMEADREEIANAARFVGRRIQELPENRQREVRRCKDAMEYVIARVESDMRLT